MTKITESELKEKVNSLREYIEIVKEADPLRPAPDRTRRGSDGNPITYPTPQPQQPLPTADPAQNSTQAAVAADRAASAARATTPGVQTAGGGGFLNPAAFTSKPAAAAQAPAPAQAAAPVQQGAKAAAPAPAPTQAPAAAPADDESGFHKFGAGIRHTAQGLWNAGADLAAGITGDNATHWDDQHPLTSPTQQPQAGGTAQAAKAKAQAPAGKQPAKAAAKGDPGVMKTQQFLKNLGHNIKIDGIWGDETETAYKAAFPNAPSNRASTAAAATAPGQTYQQAQATKQDFSKDMAAATGVQNPYASAQPAADSIQKKQGLLAKAAEFTKAGDTAKAKLYTDAAAGISNSKAPAPAPAPAPANPGVIEYNESAELDRILQLSKLVK